QQTLAEAVKSNEEFRRQLQERYKGIIVDEFQDTNTAQYEIFSKIFGGNGGDNLFFMVGDPRQAIYSFRGGDVFAYLNARNHVEKEGRCYTLSTNYRSSGDIVGHICNLFKGNSFAHDEITIGNLNAGGDNNNLHFFNRAGDVQQSPVFLVKDQDAGENGSSDDAKQARRTAVLVMQLMNGGWTIGTRDERRAVKSSDIAVLCRSNQTATAVIRELQRKGIPAYHSRQTNIMTTDEAREMAAFMNGVVHHDESSALYAALHTDICGLTEDVLAELVNTPEKYQEHYDRFKNYHNTWAGKSFSAVFAMAKGNYETFTRLASRKNGERALVNYEHLADLIQAQESRGRLTPAASLRALQRMIADADNEETPEGYEQQLASEKAALSVMTIHHSKGLEFPVVILPDVDKDDKPPSKDKAQCYHNGDGELCWNVDAEQPEDEDAREGCYLESFQEKMRLLYVALTRAKYAAFVLAGTAGGPEKAGSGKMQNANALHWLNSGGKFPFADAEERTWGDDVGGETPKMTDFEFNVSYAVWEDDSAGDAQQTELKKPKEVDLAFRNSWRMASYSGVVKHKKTQRADDGVNLIVTRDDENDEEDYDAGALPEAGLDAAGGYAAEGAAHPSFDFPRGAMIGTLIHTCLEKLDFTLEADSPEIREAVVNAFAWRYPENTPAFE
ncbi:MAG: UvrD-helicase domain-containing protein, partial [Victivallales bacterium]|nr:UvrD-helicase domain-containing protein [Victivallales bacterium]